MACFLFPRLLSFNFCYDFDIWAQDQALRSFSLECVLLLGEDYEEKFDQTCQKVLRQVGHDLVASS